jgi:hypothetical protein
VKRQIGIVRQTPVGKGLKVSVVVNAENRVVLIASIASHRLQWCSM